MEVLVRLHHKINRKFIFSFTFFFICLLLDYCITNILSKGDFTLEANPAVQLWWQTLGSFRHIELLLWPIAVFGTAYIIDSKSRFLALLWLNMLAFNHILGALTWIPNVDLNFMYITIKYDWMLGYTTTLVGLFISIPFTFLQTKINLTKTN
jgi:hypothetical protein